MRIGGASLFLARGEYYRADKKSDDSKRGATNWTTPRGGRKILFFPQGGDFISDQYFPNDLKTHFLDVFRPFGHLIFCS